MLHVLSTLLLGGASPLCVPAPATPATSVVVTAPAPSYEELYRSGRTWTAFYDGATARRELWEENAARAAVSDDMLARARAVPGSWYVLIVAVDACSDSVNSIPYIAKLVDQVDGLDLRIVDREAGKAIMEAHRTPDGRPATPTVLLLNAQFEEVGCWIERPTKLQTWYLEQKDQLSSRDLLEQKMAWYRDDAGRETVREIVEIVEAAAAGRAICSRNG